MAYTIVVVGDTGVGKTSLVNSYAGQPGAAVCATVGVEFKNINFRIDGKETKLHLWDTSGQEKFRALCPQYYRSAKGAVVVYDVTRRKSFEGIRRWIEDIRNYAEEGADIIVVGNKIDQENREVTRNEGLQYANASRFAFLETSALQGDGMHPVLEKLVRKMVPHHVVHPKPDVVRLSPATYDVAVNTERSFCDKMC